MPFERLRRGVRAAATRLIDDAVSMQRAGAFASIDRVVQTGQDPRRFVDDLLERPSEATLAAIFVQRLRDGQAHLFSLTINVGGNDSRGVGELL